MRKVLCFILICLMLPISALADVQRGDQGEDVYEVQQLLFETGFLFELPDGVFGRNTEAAVKWFQETWNLPVTGVVTDDDLNAMYDCWNGLYNPDGTLIDSEPLPDDQLEPQPLSPDIEGDLPSVLPEGEYPVCCIRYTEADGSERIGYCIRHAAIAESADLANLTGIQPETPVCQQWEDAINALYDEWMNAAEEDEQAMIASSRAALFLWINQQRVTLTMQEGVNIEANLEAVLRSHCTELCAIVYGLQK